MSIVAVHGPNTMFTTQGGGQSIPSSGGGIAQATKSPTNGLVFSFSVPSPGTRPAADFDWSFTGPGSPAAQPNVHSGTVTFTGAGAVTIVCLVNGAGTPPPANGTYTVSATATSGVPRMVEQQSGEGEGEDEVTEEIPVTTDEYDPGEHTVAEVQTYVEANPESLAAVYESEYQGKARSSLVTWLEARFPYDPGEWTVTEVLDYAAENPGELEDIIAAEQAGKNRTTLVSQLERMREA